MKFHFSLLQFDKKDGKSLDLNLSLALKYYVFLIIFHPEIEVEQCMINSRVELMISLILADR